MVTTWDELCVCRCRSADLSAEPRRQPTCRPKPRRRPARLSRRRRGHRAGVDARPRATGGSRPAGPPEPDAVPRRPGHRPSRRDARALGTPPLGDPGRDAARSWARSPAATGASPWTCRRRTKRTAAVTCGEPSRTRPSPGRAPRRGCSCRSRRWQPAPRRPRCSASIPPTTPSGTTWSSGSAGARIAPMRPNWPNGASWRWRRRIRSWRSTSRTCVDSGTQAGR